MTALIVIAGIMAAAAGALAYAVTGCHRAERCSSPTDFSSMQDD